MSFLLKQLSTMRRFSSSNRSARVISRPPFAYAMPGVVPSVSAHGTEGDGGQGVTAHAACFAIRAAGRMAFGVGVRGRLVCHHSHAAHGVAYEGRAAAEGRGSKGWAGGSQAASPVHRGARVVRRRATLPLRSVGERSKRGRGQAGGPQLPVRIAGGAKGVVIARDR